MRTLNFKQIYYFGCVLDPVLILRSLPSGPKRPTLGSSLHVYFVPGRRGKGLRGLRLFSNNPRTELFLFTVLLP